jgi:3-hydroxyacyl-CoA dehydrogenase
MPLVEVVPHAGTSDSTIQGALAFYKSVGRKPVHIKQEVPGFVANRLQAALCNEAYSLVARAVLSAEDLGESIDILLYIPLELTCVLDAYVTTSIGPRWAVVGPLLANAMGGGGGSDGFRHLLEHLGPASREWTKDMQAHSFAWTPESMDTLTQSVGEELNGKDMAALERQRDNRLVEMFKVKGHRRTSFSSLDF